MPNVFSWFLTPPLRGEREEWLVLTAWKRSDVAFKCHSFDNLMCLFVSIWPKEFVLTVVEHIGLSRKLYVHSYIWHVEVSRLPIAAMAYTSKVPVPAIASPNQPVKSAEAAVFVCVFCGQEFFPRCKKLHSFLGEKLVPGHIAWWPGGVDFRCFRCIPSQWTAPVRY